MKVTIYCLINLATIVCTINGEEAIRIVTFDRGPDLAQDIKDALDYLSPTKKVKVHIVFSSDILTTSASMCLTYNTKYSLNNFLEAGVRTLVQKPKLSHYVTYRQLRSKDNLYVTVFSISKAQLNTLLDFISAKRVEIVEVTSIYDIIGCNVASTKNTTLVLYSTTGKDKSPLITILLYVDNFLLANRDIYLDFDSLDSGLDTTLKYANTLKRGLSINKFFVIGDMSLAAITSIEDELKVKAEKLIVETVIYK